MKKYYLHNGTESSGPFDIEELKAKNISKTTPVWFEGMQHWKTAGEIPELTRLFVANPPPITSFSTPPPTPKEEKTTKEHKILGLSRNTFFIVCGVLVLTTATLVFNNIQENRSRELRIKNHKTEVENYQLELKQKEIEEEKIQAVIQEKIDAERMAREKKQNSNSRLSEIGQLLVDYQNNLDATEKKLKDASGFKLLRTAAEKKEQMDLLQKNIDSFKNEINQLKNESDQLKLELEKIPE
ncbi:GYF domain-containing protein [Flavobacterium limnophilum]|uniref:GYF domain-containing protein n=1 Tax=Flavobacterium limnophilum TaxID=3003262 RepID=UPI0022ABC7F5|nr:GYF domain-containing protein [Flavobacterium limnophilum]